MVGDTVAVGFRVTVAVGEGLGVFVMVRDGFGVSVALISAIVSVIVGTGSDMAGAQAPAKKKNKIILNTWRTIMRSF